MAGRFTIEAVFKAIDKVTAPVSRMQNNVLKMTRKTRQGFMTLNRSVSNVAGGMKRAAVGMAASLAIVAFAMTNVIANGMEFEQQVVNATAKINGLKKGSLEFSQAMKTIEESARKAGSTTEFTATEVARALNELTTAGFTAEQAAKSIRGVIDLATIAQIDLAEAADISTGALGGFGLKVDDAAQRALNLARINDVLAKTSTTSKAKIEDLAEALTKGASAVRVAGGDVETFGALTGVMAEGMIRGSVAGTTIAQMYKKLAVPTAKATKMWRKWNIEIQDNEGNLTDIADIMQKLAPQIKKLGTKQALAALTELFGQRGFKGAAVILAQGDDSLRSFREELRKSGGAARDMADIMRDFTLGNWKKFISAINETRLKLFDLAKGPFLAMVKVMAEFVIKHDDMILKLKPFVPLIIGVSAVMLVLFGIFVSLTVAVTTLGFVLQGVLFVMTNLALIKMALPFIGMAAGAMFAAVALIALTAIVIGFNKEWEVLMKDLKDSESFWANFAEFVLRPVTALTTIKTLVEEISEELSVGFVKPILLAEGILSDISNNFKELTGFGTPLTDQEKESRDRQLTDEGLGGERIENIIEPRDNTDRLIVALRRAIAQRAEVTIKDESGRAEVTGGKLGNGLSLESSGGYN